MAEWDVVGEDKAADPWAVAEEVRAPARPDFSNVRGGFATTETPYAAQRFDRQPIESRIARSNLTRELVGLEPIDAPQAGDLGELFTRGLVAIPERVGSLARLGPGLSDALARATGIPQLAAIAPTSAPPVRQALAYLSDVLSEPARNADAVQYGTPSVQAADLSAALGVAPRETITADGVPIPEPGLLDRAGTVGRFVVEQGARALPEMLATVAAPTAYIGGRTQEIAEARAGNEGLGAQPGLTEYGIAAPAAAIETLLERYTTGRLLPGGSPVTGNIVGRIAKETGLQGGLGGLEELAPYLAEQAGTQAPATAGGALDTFLAGALAEGALGGGVQGAKEVASRLPPRTFDDVAPPRAEIRPEPVEPKATSPRPPAPEVQAAAPEAVPTAKPRVSLADVQAEQARRAAEEVPEPTAAPEPVVPPVERRADAIEQQRLGELRALRRTGEITPEQSAELLELGERDRLSAKVAGRRIQGVQTMEARNELESAGSLKPVQAFADADNFKAVNDRLGHDVGDSVIRNMGELFAIELGPGNVFHRGGDEFVLQADSPEHLDTAMNRVRDTLGRSVLRATLSDGTTVEQNGVGFSYGAGSTVQEAENAQFADKEARRAAGLRTERAADAGPVRAEAGAGGPQAGESGAGAPAQVTPAVGTKNAAVAARRELEGRDPILKEAARGNEDTLTKAFTDLANNPSRGDEVVVKLANAGKQGISLDDEATLLVHMSDLRQQRDRAADVLADPKASEEAKEVATREYGELEGRLNSAEQAAAASGREWGRFGQFRQRMLADDFTLEALERKERARLQRPLERKEIQSVKVMAEKIAAAQKRAEAAESRAAQVQSEAAYDALLRHLSTVPKQRPTLAKLQAAADESRAELNRILGRTTTSAGVNPLAFYHAARIGAYHVANGLTKLADWTARMREDLGDLAERLNLPDVFKAALAQAKRPIAAGASPAEVAAKIQGEPTGKDVRAVAEAHVRAGLRGASEVFQATADTLGLTEQQVRDRFTQTEQGAPRTVDEAKAEIARLRKELQREARESTRPAREEASQLKAIRKRINALQDRIAAGDFAKPERVQKTLTAAVEKARFEEAQAKEEFIRHQFEADLKARPPLSKALGYGKDTINLLQSFQTSIDLGALLKQGLFVTTSHPVRTIKSLRDVAKATISQQGYHAVQQSIQRRDNAAKYKKYGVQFTDIGQGPLSKVEEAYATRLIAKMPKVEGQRIRNAIRTAVNTGLAPIRASGRAHATVLNLMRADTFDAFVDLIGEPTPQEYKHIAKIANVFTGRGSFGKSDNAGDIINAVAFAPRLYMSRLQLLTGQVFAGGTRRTNLILAKEYARALSMIGLMMTLAALIRDPEDEKKGIPLIDPDLRGADGGKLRFGDTRVDLGGGLLQFAVLFARLIAGETVASTKVGDEDDDKRRLRPLRDSWRLSDAIPELSYTGARLEKKGFAGRDILDVATSFIRSKLRPVVGAAVNVAAGEDFRGQPTSLQREALGLVTPMSVADVAKVMEANGIPRGTILSLFAVAGASASVYADTPIADIDAQYAQALKELKKARKEGKGLEPEGFKATEKGVTALNKAVKRLAEAEAINYADLWATAEVAPEVAAILGDSPRGAEQAPVRLVRRVHEAVIKAREEAKRGAIRQLGQTPVDEEAQAGG